MGQTPGDKLEWELSERDISKTDFAKTVKRSFQTVFNWCQNIGFKEAQQEIAAAALGEPSDFFKFPDLVAERENFRRSVLRSFAETKLGLTLSQDEVRSLESFRWPEGRSPSVSDCKGLVRIMRGQLTRAEFDDSADDMRTADPGTRSVETKEPPTPKKPPKRGKPTPPHKRPRK